MRRIATIPSSILYLLTASSVFAQEITLNRPTVDGNNAGYANISEFINNAITLAFIIAVVLVLGMLVWGAVEWITSGGDKDAVGKARGKIINALIGLAILAVAYALARLGGQFVGVDITNLPIPDPL